jgi:hypothetical protein
MKFSLYVTYANHLRTPMIGYCVNKMEVTNVRTAS